MTPLRIIVVDDSAMFRTLLRNVLKEIPACEVVASVADGKTAVDKIAELQPDLLTLDVEMPEVSGIDVLRELKRRRIHSKVLMVSRLTTAGAQVTTDALIEGALDFILKPSGGSASENKLALRTALETRITALRESVPGITLASAAPLVTSSSKTAIELVVIGCSTGGPDALSRIIPDLSATFPVPILIVQHMPDGFTATLARRLDESSEVKVLLAAEGLTVRPGQIALARGGRHLRVARRMGNAVIVSFSDDPHEQGCRPAVDFTLRSAVEHFQDHLLSVILTGMGRDGLAGCKLVKASGGQVLAQHAEGCTLYGMPKAVVQAGLADNVIPLSNMAKSIERLVRRAISPCRSPVGPETAKSDFA